MNYPTPQQKATKQPRSRSSRVAALLAGCSCFLALSPALRGADLYLSAPGVGKVEKISTSGAVSTFATATTPKGLAFDSAGNLFVADQGTASVIKITPAGAISTFASGLGLPNAVRFDAGGNLYVSDLSANVIYKFTPAGVRTTFVAGLNGPADMAFDAAGNLFEVDRGTGLLLKFTPGGVRTTFASGLNLPAGLAFDSQGNLYEVDQGTFTIFKFSPNGTRTTFATLDSSVVFAPIRLAVDSADNIYLGASLQAGGSEIYKYTLAGARSDFASLPDVTGFLAFAPSQLGNISTRASVLTGNQLLIGGFIISGSANKQVLVEALGPTLAQFHVTGVLADPILTLHHRDALGHDTIVATNDDWKIPNQAAIQATGKAPLNDAEPAILASLAPGNYTAVVSGKNNTTGVALMEVFDQDGSAVSRLTNVSTRGFVGTGNAAMIGGFISGNGSAKVIVRALGPTLSQFGVTGVLANPLLELHDTNGAIIVSNDDWTTSPQRAEIQASGFAPPNALEPAIIISRPAGNTSAIVRGVNNGTGNALVEVYTLP